MSNNFGIHINQLDKLDISELKGTLGEIENRFHHFPHKVYCAVRAEYDDDDYLMVTIVDLIEEVSKGATWHYSSTQYWIDALRAKIQEIDPMHIM